MRTSRAEWKRHGPSSRGLNTDEQAYGNLLEQLRPGFGQVTMLAVVSSRMRFFRGFR
jgi:hypothetical protein